jgi:hypothetical protein
MKKLFIFAATIFCIFSLVYIASAAEVTLEWDAPGNAEWGTRLYIGTSPGQYNFSSDAGSGTVQFTISNLSLERPIISRQNTISTAWKADILTRLSIWCRAKSPNFLHCLGSTMKLGDTS